MTTPTRCPYCGFLGAHRAGCSLGPSRLDPATLIKRTDTAAPSVGRAATYAGAAAAVFLVFAAIPLLLIGGIAAGLGIGTAPFRRLIRQIVGYASYRASILVRRARASMRLPVQRLLDDPKVAPVLYLRSFADDVSTELDRTTLPSMFGWTPPLADEEVVTKTLGRIAPVVAIGNPSTSAAPLGAYRVYVGDDGWQEMVQKLMARACLVVLRPGHSEGVQWEWRLICRDADPCKVLVYFTWQGYRAPRWREFVARAGPHLPRALPETMDGRCLVFDDGWIPSWEPELEDALEAKGLAFFPGSWSKARGPWWLGFVMVGSLGFLASLFSWVRPKWDFLLLVTVPVMMYGVVLLLYKAAREKARWTVRAACLIVLLLAVGYVFGLHWRQTDDLQETPPSVIVADTPSTDEKPLPGAARFPTPGSVANALQLLNSDTASPSQNDHVTGDLIREDFKDNPSPSLPP